MSPLSSVKKLMQCPPREVLIGFNLGKLSSPDTEVIGSHIENCTRCENILAEIDQSPMDVAGDPMMRNLHDCFAPQPIVDEAGCAFLQAAVRALATSGTGRVGATASFSKPAEEPWVGKVVGNYEIVDLVGKGGMGIVFKARQNPVERMVALKMIQLGAYSGTAAMRRFRTEGQAIARLHHANVVQIFEFGDEESIPYFSMELVEGGSLARKLMGDPLPFREAADLARTIARAIHFAHEQHVIHRDLKPGNILLTPGGVPKISDFGLAKLLDVDEDQTRSEQILGTPTYMAPEQAAGNEDRMQPAVDIYALGVILYEMLTGRPPFRGPSKSVILEQVRNVEPLPPSQRRPKLPADLEAICLKCLEKKPQARYATAEALAEDLDRWLKGEPTVARPARWHRKVWRTVKRHKVGVGVGLAMACLLMVGFVVQAQNHLPEIEAELKKGKPVTLVGEKGRPKWFRMVAGEERSKASLAPDGVFALDTWGLCLVELVPNPQHDYRITAEIRHERADLRGKVGLYCARHAHPGRDGDCHVFVDMVYNDIRSITEFLPLVLDEKNKPLLKPPKGEYFRIRPELFYQRIGGLPLTYTYDGVIGGKFQHVGTRPDPTAAQWRRLEITVTAAGVTGARDDIAVGEAKAELIGEKYAEGLKYEANLYFNDQAWLAAVPAEFRAHGGCGLYVHKGSASFRNVCITPLRKGESQ